MKRGNPQTSQLQCKAPSGNLDKAGGQHEKEVLKSLLKFGVEKENKK